MLRKIILLLFLCRMLIVVVNGVTLCNDAANVDSNGQPNRALFWNTACTDLLNPYCTESATGLGCHACAPFKNLTQYSMCDCPPNQICDPITTSPSYGFCIDFPLRTATCASPADCPILVYCGGTTSCNIGYYSCVNGVCAPCNNVDYPIAAGFWCPGGSPYPGSSRQGETRYCAANGFWVGGGMINVTNSPPSSSPVSSTSPPSPGSSTSPAPSPSTSTAATKPKSAMLVCILLVALWRANRHY